MDQFSPEAVAKYEETLLQAQQQGIRIRALMLVNPHNPLGRCYPRESIIGYMKLCAKYDIHLFVDEIYALSVYHIPGDPKAEKFESVSSWDTTPYIRKEMLHVLYGMSKDVAASGLRLGVLYTQNDELFRALSAEGTFHWSGAANEKVAIAMLEGKEWMSNLLELSRERLASRNILTRQLLEKHGIDYIKGANAGFFLMVDLRPFLPPAGPPTQTMDPDAEWRMEAILAKRMFEHKVFITPGKDQCAEEPGWFRIIFSQDEKAVEEGLSR